MAEAPNDAIEDDPVRLRAGLLCLAGLAILGKALIGLVATGFRRGCAGCWWVPGSG